MNTKHYPLLARLLCSLEGNYLEVENESVENSDSFDGLVQCLTFSCSIPAVNGRGFIEVMLHSLCSEVCPYKSTSLMLHFMHHVVPYLSRRFDGSFVIQACLALAS